MGKIVFSFSARTKLNQRSHLASVLVVFFWEMRMSYEKTNWEAVKGWSRKRSEGVCCGKENWWKPEPAHWQGEWGQLVRFAMYREGPDAGYFNRLKASPKQRRKQDDSRSLGCRRPELKGILLTERAQRETWVWGRGILPSCLSRKQWWQSKEQNFRFGICISVWLL